MATITGHYNVTVNSRYYVFLQEDLESAEPDVLMANVEKKRELRKESKTKAKKEKRSKQVAEAIKESVKVENMTEEIVKPEMEIVEQNKPEVIDCPIEIQEPIVDERPTDNKTDRGNRRGRGGSSSNRRQNSGPRRGGYPRNDDRTYNNDENSHQKSQDGEHNKFTSNNRGGGGGSRPFRKERSEFSGESSGRIGFFDDNSNTNTRGNPVRRRPSGRPSGRYNRGGGDRPISDRQPNERSTYDRNGNERFNNNDRNGNERNGFDKNRVDNEENMKIDIIPENMGTFEDMSSRPPRSSRGRYPRSYRGGFNRYNASNNENDFENNKIGYFDENMENREFRGGRGRSRGRGMRRGRGESWRQKGSDREENYDDGSSNNMKTETHDVPSVEKWPECDEELDPESNNNEPIINTAGVTESDFNDFKKSNWGEIEDDPVELKPTNEHMTLEEYRALHSKEKVISSQEGKETRKANDGQDVFSGMEEYRKGRLVEEQGDDHENHESQHGRQKQSIPLAIRFSRNTEYGGDSNNFEQTTVENRNFSRGYYKTENKYRSDNSSSGDRGRSRGGSDFSTYGRGRDFNRGRGRFNRNPYPVKRKEDQVDGVNINLGNEDEFPTLS